MKCAECGCVIDSEESGYWENEDGDPFCSEGCLDTFEDRLADNESEAPPNEEIDECGMTQDGYCMLAGTEHCDFDCPFSG